MNVFTRLAITSVVALVSVCSAVVVIASAPMESDFARTLTAPGASWTVDAADVLGNEFATFDDPAGARFAEVKGGVVDTGDVLVAKVGLTNQDSKEFEKTKLVGIDTSTGEIRWTTAADGIESCGTVLLDGKILCRTDADVVTVDPAVGDITRYPSGWNIFGVGTDGSDVYVVEGEQDGYTVRMHRGSLDDLDSEWTSTIENAWAYDTVGDMIRLVDGNGILQLSSGTALFDAATGEIDDMMTAPDCVRGSNVREDSIFLVVGRRCSDLFEFRTDLVDSTGRVVVSTDAEVWQRVTLDTSRGKDPVVFGGAVHDPVSGEQLWADDTVTADVAIVDGVVLSQYGPTRDIRTGEELWVPDGELQSRLPAATFGGLAYTVGWENIVGFDPRSGERRAAVRLDDLLGNTGGRSEQVALQHTDHGVLVVNESRLNLLR